MLSRQENELVTRTGPGTPMGDVMRRYWMPILLEREVAEPDGEPVRVQVLGERLVAFRDTNGRIGLIDELCPHRRVSLWLGRNEECGLRCVYHGWKFDVDGNCVDQMNEPGENSFADKVHIKHYPTLELGGIVWAYMGPAERTPPPPCFEFTQVAATPPSRVEGDRGVQLAAGAGGRHRHLARADPASRAHAQPASDLASTRAVRSCAAARRRSRWT